MENLKTNRHAIHREAGFLEAYGYWAKLGTISYYLVAGMAEFGFVDAPHLPLPHTVDGYLRQCPSQRHHPESPSAVGDSDAVKAASRERMKWKEENICLMVALGRVLTHLSVD